jgi:hypothetical protein
VHAGPSGLSAANKPLKRMVGRRRPPRLTARR